LFAAAVAAWPWKRAIYANRRPSVDKHNPFSVSSGRFLPLFLWVKNKDLAKKRLPVLI
jgi:hypothetical protein